MGRRTTVRAAALVLLGGLATSCAASGPSGAEIEEWLESRLTTVEGSVVGAMSSDIRPQGEADEPAATLQSVRVEVFGEDVVGAVHVAVLGGTQPRR